MDPTMKQVIDMGGRITCEQVAWMEEWVEGGGTPGARVLRELRFGNPAREKKWLEEMGWTKYRLFPLYLMKIEKPPGEILS